MSPLEKILFNRLHDKSFSPKYHKALMNVLHKLIINNTYHVELSSIYYKPKNKSWIIKKQYEG